MRQGDPPSEKQQSAEQKPQALQLKERGIEGLKWASLHFKRVDTFDILNRSL
jgi:hypothetical protein